MNRRIVIIGGVAGGASAAARLRRLNEQDEIVMFERGEHVSFANCGLPYYIGGSINSREKLFLQTPKGIKDRFNIDVRVLTEVTSIDREQRLIRFRNTVTGEEGTQAYDLVVLSPGARPIMPEIPGIENAANLFTLRNVQDTDRIKGFVDERHPRHATVIGGGFIGLEMAENLRERGVEVTLLDRGEQLLNPLDPEMAILVEQHMSLNGVDIRLKEGVKEFKSAGRELHLTSGDLLHTDMVIMAIGVSPENDLAQSCGLELGFRGAVKVNAQLQTSDPAIYAVGDAIEVKDWNHGFASMVSLAWGANRQGRLVADHINGKPIAYEGALGTAIIKTFALTAASTGNNEKTLRRLNVPYKAVHLHPNSHAGYYPGSSPISMKLLFNPETGEIYGAQAVGAEGVDKRIDVIATAIRGKLNVQELADIELAYAPPYSSAKDPVNMAGYIASNLMDGLVDTLQWHEVDAFHRNGGLIIDVRDAAELLAGAISGSIHIPLGQLRGRLAEIPREQEIAVSCQVGLRGYIAARLLSQHGYRVRNVDGGYKTYASMLRAGRLTQSPEVGSSPTGGGPTQAKSKQLGPEHPSEVPVTHNPIGTNTQLTLLDTCGLQCPGPILKVYETVQSLEEGSQLEVTSTDFGFAADIEQWCHKTGNTLEALDVSQGKVTAVLRKGRDTSQNPDGRLMIPESGSGNKNGSTMVVFSGDLDKAIASFIIATGAVAMGKQVTMFFTFWGLNILRKIQAPAVEKSGMERMFGLMMPQGSKSLPLSKMNMGGLGPKMIRHAMEQKNVDSLEQLMQGAMNAGVRMIACTMSMDIMGIKKEELLDGVDFGGVASYLGAADDAGVNLFI
ncbi:CoA-disulfide reductase [Paenibacillus agri]|uniref:CoA-disulfide reductase n=1 Tax=Paenibacillus agri TaxID=2744309 RepID=A0A850EWU9_9BACL|nr:CoA-disulfide reductase [Paenibacillus agri]NUU63974.1 CoA-disulfide reductase [Paenibacillus agri]